VERNSDMSQDNNNPPRTFDSIGLVATEPQDLSKPETKLLPADHVGENGWNRFCDWHNEVLGWEPNPRDSHVIRLMEAYKAGAVDMYEGRL
jgi:hypothetical protein